MTMLSLSAQSALPLSQANTEENQFRIATTYICMCTTNTIKNPFNKHKSLVKVHKNLIFFFKHFRTNEFKNFFFALMKLIIKKRKNQFCLDVCTCA